MPEAVTPRTVRPTARGHHSRPTRPAEWVHRRPISGRDMRWPNGLLLRLAGDSHARAEAGSGGRAVHGCVVALDGAWDVVYNACR